MNAEAVKTEAVQTNSTAIPSANSANLELPALAMNAGFAGVSVCAILPRCRTLGICLGART